jgi:hypothetical protein
VPIEARDAQHLEVPMQSTVAVFETAPESENVIQVRTVSTNNFLGWWSGGFYFPQFGAAETGEPERTDDNMQLYPSEWLEFNFSPWDDKNTFAAAKPVCAIPSACMSSRTTQIMHTIPPPSSLCA